MQETRSTVCDLLVMKVHNCSLNHSILIMNFWPLSVWKWTKSSASGGLDPHQGLCPWTSLGAPPPDLCYRLAFHARLGVTLPHFQTPSTVYDDLFDSF